MQVAIDGPAGAGKSTISDLIAEKLGILHLDTGAMYRAFALKAIREGIPTTDREALAILAGKLDLKILFENGRQVNCLDGVDVSPVLRTPEVSRGASDAAVFPEVRTRMVELQREIASRTDLVIDGRDIGTYVLPNAEVKIYLTASSRERAERRLKQQRELGLPEQPMEEIVRDIEYRDKNDSQREFAPLRKAEDAILVDSTDKQVDEVVEIILTIIRDKNTGREVSHGEML
jgi:cytidylate kinase